MFLFILLYNATEKNKRRELTMKLVADTLVPNDGLRQRVNWALIISPISEFPGGVAMLLTLRYNAPITIQKLCNYGDLCVVEEPTFRQLTS